MYRGLKYHNFIRFNFHGVELSWFASFHGFHVFTFTVSEFQAE